MNIYDFFISQDIADHCQSIGHTFNPVEMAVIIYKSHRPETEKQAAFHELIEDYPDMLFHKSVDFPVRTSLHDYLRALIDYRKENIAAFMEPADKKSGFEIGEYDLSYMHLMPETGVEELVVEKNRKISLSELDAFLKKSKSGRKRKNAPAILGAYHTVEQLLEDARPYWDQNTTRHITVSKKKCDLKLMFNYNGEIISMIDHSKNHPGHLDELYVSLPIPFKNGDIVASIISHGNDPLLLKNLPEIQTFPFVSGQKIGVFHMPSAYYYTTQYGYLQDSECQQMRVPIDSLEYSRNPLQGRDSILTVLCDYIKENSTDPNCENTIGELMEYMGAAYTVCQYERTKNPLIAHWKKTIDKE